MEKLTVNVPTYWDQNQVYVPGKLFIHKSTQEICVISKFEDENGKTLYGVVYLADDEPYEANKLYSNLQDLIYTIYDPDDYLIENIALNCDLVPHK